MSQPNRRSRTDCTTYTDIARDLGNTNPNPSKPILPSIENSDNNSLFKWARNINLSLDEWFDIIGSVLNDNSDGIKDLFDCACIGACSTCDDVKACDAMDIVHAQVGGIWLLSARTYKDDFLFDGIDSGFFQEGLATAGPLKGTQLRVPSNAVFDEAEGFDPTDGGCAVEADIWKGVNNSPNTGESWAFFNFVNDAYNNLGQQLNNRHSIGVIVYPQLDDYDDPNWDDGNYLQTGDLGTFAVVGAEGVDSEDVAGSLNRYGVKWNAKRGQIIVDGGSKGGDTWVIHNSTHPEAVGFDTSLPGNPVKPTVLMWEFERLSNGYKCTMYVNGVLLFSKTTTTLTNTGNPAIADQAWFGRDTYSGDYSNGELVTRTFEWNRGYGGLRREGRSKYSWIFGGTGGLPLASLSKMYYDAALKTMDTYVDGDCATRTEDDIGKVLKLQTLAADSPSGADEWCPTWMLPQGAPGQVLSVKDLTNPDSVEWIWPNESDSIINTVPDGGKEGQHLEKLSDADGDYVWADRDTKVFFEQNEPTTDDTDLQAGDFWTRTTAI